MKKFRQIIMIRNKIRKDKQDVALKKLNLVLTPSPLQWNKTDENPERDDRIHPEKKDDEE